MEGGDTSAVVAPPPKTRRGSGGSVYEKYLNIKSNVLPDDEGATPSKKSMEIPNSSDLEAGEVVSTEANKTACANRPSGEGVSAEPEMEPQAHSEPQQSMADTLQLESSAAFTSTEDNAQLTTVGTFCASAAASTVNASTIAPPTADAPPGSAPISPSAAAFERARAPTLFNPSSPSHLPPNEQYASKRMEGHDRITGNAHDMSPRMGRRGGPPRGRSRSRDRNGMSGNMNGGNRPWSPPRGLPENGRFDGPASRDKGPFNGHPGGPRSSGGGFGSRPGSPYRNGFEGRSGSPPRNGYGGGPGSPPRGNFDKRPGSPPRGGFNGRPGSPPRNCFNGRLSSPPRSGFYGRPVSPRRGGFNGRPVSPPRDGFNRRPVSPPRDGFNGRSGGPPRASFNGRPGSPCLGGFNGRPGSPPRAGFNGRPGSPPRNGFACGRDSPRRDGFNGPTDNRPRGRSPPRDGIRRGPPMSPERNGPPRDIRDGLGPGQGSPRGGIMGGRGIGGPRRSRSPLRELPRSPPRNGNGFGPRPDQRPGYPGPHSPPRGPGQRSPPRGGFNGQSPGGRPPFDARGWGQSPMGRPPSPIRGRNFGPRFDNRGPPGPEYSPGRDGPLQGRSRSPNRPPPGDMMRKRDRSWERGSPPPDMIRRPFNGPGPLPDSPRSMEPRPFDAPSEWNFELKRSGKVKCRCSATSLSVGLNRQLPLYLDVVMLPHLSKSPEFLQLERPNVRRVVYELKPESMADASGYREFVDYLIQGRSGHARAGGAAEMDPQGFKVFILPPGQAARQLGYKGDHMVAVLRSR